MNIEVLLTESEIADELVESIAARDLPEKFFYWSPLSVECWRALSSRSDEALRETWAGLASKAGDLTRTFRGVIPVISFGSGEGLRDRELLKALKAADREAKYFPVDSSQSLLEMA